MTRIEANKILNSRREGVDFADARIAEALLLTRDLGCSTKACDWTELQRAATQAWWLLDVIAPNDWRTESLFEALKSTGAVA